jgi:hypothetical protein
MSTSAPIADPLFWKAWLQVSGFVFSEENSKNP